MYDLHDFAEMVNDRVRMSAYLEALRDAISPSSIVMDIGAGSGIFSLLACKLGARKVYAVDPSDAIHAARIMARENGCGGTIEAIRGTSYDLPVREPVDVIVSDLRGVLPLFRRHIATIIDARKRFLRPNGVLIPARDTLWAALVSLPDWYKSHIEAIANGPCGLDLSSWRSALVNSVRRVKVNVESLVTNASCWAEIDYATVSDPNISATLDWVMRESATAHGIALWFDAELDERNKFSNHPGGPVDLYGRLVLPLSNPIQFGPGDRVQVSLQAKLIGEDYAWQWETRVMRTEVERQHQPVMRQSTFYADALLLGHFDRTSSIVPALNEDGNIARLLLSALDGGWTLEMMARRLNELHPARFPDRESARRNVQDFIQRFGCSDSDFVTQELD